MQSFLYILRKKGKHFIPALDPDLHFGGMHIHINLFWIYGNVQHGKRKLMLHHILSVAFFQCLGQQIIPYKSSIHKEQLIGSAGTVDLRLSNVAADMAEISFFFKRDHTICHFPSIDPVDHFLQIPVSGSMESDSTAIYKFKGNIRSGHRNVLHQI